jgi:hypothetical protein
VQIETQRRLALLAFVLVVAASPGLAQAQNSEPTYENGGLGAAAALCSLVYAPIKLTSAILGLVVGGLAYPLSGGDSDVTMRIINNTVRGDYVITPSHLRGDQPIEFFGHAPEPEPEPASGY